MQQLNFARGINGNRMLPCWHMQVVRLTVKTNTHRIEFYEVCRGLRNEEITKADGRKREENDYLHVIANR